MTRIKLTSLFLIFLVSSFNATLPAQAGWKSSLEALSKTGRATNDLYRLPHRVEPDFSPNVYYDLNYPTYRPAPSVKVGKDGQVTEVASSRQSTFNHSSAKSHSPVEAQRVYPRRGSVKINLSDRYRVHASHDFSIPDTAHTRLRQIRTGKTSLPNYKGGAKYENSGENGEQILPIGGVYKEYDVYPRLKKTFNRGPDRIVFDEKSGRAWYTPNHYKNFIEMK